MFKICDGSRYLRAGWVSKRNRTHHSNTRMNQNLITQLIKPSQHRHPMLKHHFFFFFLKKGGGPSPACSPGPTGMGYYYSLTLECTLKRSGKNLPSIWPRREDQCHMSLKSPNWHILIILSFQVFKPNTAWVLQVRPLSVTKLFRSSLAILTYTGE